MSGAIAMTTAGSSPLHASPETSAIFCRGLSKTYGKIRALADLDLAVPFGSVFGFLGRNGAGKTTTMRLLAGLALPSSGNAWVAGWETTGVNRLARARFGYLPQDPAFYSWMSAREYLDYIGKIQGLSSPERKRQVGEMLELSDLKEASRRRIGGYSGGMVQRLGIAQALMGHPPVLLLDEPTSSLDPGGRHEVLEMISKIGGKVTVFFSSHILNDIERVCDTVAVLHKGRLILVSGREELLEKYAVNAAELEMDSNGGGDGGTAIPRFLDRVKQCAWVAAVKREGTVLRIMVHNVPVAKKELLPLVADSGLIVNRFEWVRPSLEEIFLQLSAED
jgi:ABC-2 type transport system ATP-binding protein